MIIDAGSAHSPKTPYMHTGLLPGKNIQNEPGLGIDEAKNAIEYGKQIGESLGALADCLVLGESVPGGTTTALAVLRAFEIKARTSSSMPENPGKLKESIAVAAAKTVLHLVIPLHKRLNICRACRPDGYSVSCRSSLFCYTKDSCNACRLVVHYPR